MLEIAQRRGTRHTDLPVRTSVERASLAVLRHELCPGRRERHRKQNRVYVRELVTDLHE